MHALHSLENRRLFAVDLVVSALTSTLPASSEEATIVKLKTTAKVTLKNLGPDALAKTAAKCTVTVVLKGADNTEYELAKNDKVVLASLKNNATKILTLPLKLPTSLALGNYTLLARVDTTNVIPESDETNNSFSTAPIAINASGTTLFAQYGFADQMTFTQTSHTVEDNVVHEEGTFVDRNGTSGSYLYVLNVPILGKRQLSFTLYTNNNGGHIWTSTNLIASGKLATTLNAKVGNFSAKSNGGLQLYCAPVATGNKVFFKLT